MNRNRKKAVAASVAVGMTMVMGVSPVLAADTDISKEETVYVNAAADGTPEDITVSDWLKNSASAGDLSDESDLKDIKNVKGDETFEQDGSNLTWNTEDKDIYYQGTTNKDLPVSMEIKYYLDGVQVSPSDLGGKSGHLKIEVNYTNKVKNKTDRETSQSVSECRDWQTALISRALMKILIWISRKDLQWKQMLQISA